MIDQEEKLKKKIPMTHVQMFIFSKNNKYILHIYYLFISINVKDFLLSIIFSVNIQAVHLRKHARFINRNNIYSL